MKKTRIFGMCAAVIAVMLCVSMLLAGCGKKGNDTDTTTTGGVDTNVGEVVNHNADIKLVNETLTIDGKTVEYSEMSVQWMLDNGFVLTSAADYSPDHTVRAFGTETFGFVKKGSESNQQAVMISLTYMNDSDSQQKFSSARLCQIHVELADEATSAKFEDVTVEGPLGIKDGVTFDALKETLGEPAKISSTDTESARCGYTTYEWLCGTKDYVRVRLGDTMGLLQFDIITN